MRQYWMLLAGLIFAGTAMAADKADFGRDKVAVDAATAPAMGGFGGDAEALTSLRGTGKVKIGGDVLLRYAYSRVKAADVSYSASDWEPDTAELNFQVDACDNGKLFITLDLTDGHYGPGFVQQDDLLKEIYFTLESVCGTGFGVTLGKTEVPFGMGRDDLAIHPYMDDFGNSFLNNQRNGYAAGFASYENFGHSKTYDHSFMVMPFYQISDTLKIEAAIFQDPAGRTQGFRYTNDPGFSFAGRIAWNPIEDLAISASAVTRYNRGNGRLTPPADEDRMYATSIGFDWNPCFFSKKLNVFAEWQHSWNADIDANGFFNADLDSDNIYAGLSFDVTEALKVFAQYEWLSAQGDGAAYYRQLQRAIVAGQYSFASGMYVEAGYQHEWGKGDAGGLGKAYADVIYTAFGWSF